MFFIFLFRLFRFSFSLNCSVSFCWWIVFGVVLFVGGFFICFLVCFALFVLECFYYFWFFSCCFFTACLCFVLCTSWSGLGVVNCFAFFGLFRLCLF